MQFLHHDRLLIGKSGPLNKAFCITETRLHAHQTPDLICSVQLRANLPTSACSARLNATVLNDLLPRGHDWSGLQYSLEDAWKGLKDDPLKVGR